MNTKQKVLIALAVVGALITGYSLKSEPVIAEEGSAGGYISLRLDPDSTHDAAFALINTEQKMLMIYKIKYQKGTKKASLALDSTRSFRFDEQLETWKTEPKLSDIEKAVKKAAAKRK